jgi:hypothetical protein
MTRRIMRQPSQWMSSVMRKDKGRLSTRRNLIWLGARKAVAREWTLLSLSLRSIKAIERSLMTKDKRRYSYRTLQSPKTRKSQRGYTIIRKRLEKYAGLAIGEMQRDETLPPMQKTQSLVGNLYW